MIIEEKIQKTNGEYNIYDDILNKLKEKNLINMYIVAGIIKDEAFNLLKDFFVKARNKGVNLNFVIGIDRKTTSENLLKDILEISSKSYMYNNNQEETINAKVYIFEYKKRVEILIPTTNFTANGITNNYSNVTSIVFDLPNDEDEYNSFMFSIKEYIYPDSDVFTIITKKSIEEASLARELAVIKVTDLKLPSISDYLKITNENKKIPDEKEIEEKIQNKIKGIVKNFDVLLEEDDILIPDNVLIQEDNTEEIVEKEKKKKVVIKKKK